HLLNANSASELILEFTAVPEPSTLAFGAVALGALAWRRRRRSLAKSASEDNHRQPNRASQT
ncbi:MAG TPA: PEP-CTERM sorting domain-containing protein, partial [Pirellulales bacterium]|nr:PEP-CTERM sorting domain-containing protein [Pirellulales bacterium]